MYQAQEEAAAFVTTDEGLTYSSMYLAHTWYPDQLAAGFVGAASTTTVEATGDDHLVVQVRVRFAAFLRYVFDTRIFVN